MPAPTVFDVPDELGTLVWSAGWREDSSLFARILIAGAGTVAVAFAYFLITGRGHGAILPRDLALLAIVFVLGFLLAAPARYCRCLGHAGFSLSTQRFGFSTRTRLVEFADVGDVDVHYTRIVSDAVHQIYSHTDVTFRWLDHAGNEIFLLAGALIEPSLRGAYDADAPIDLERVGTLGARNEATLGFAAVDWFAAFQAKRT